MRGQFLFCFDHAVAWDSSRNGPANIPHATVGSHLKVRFWDYLLANFLTFHRAASEVCSVTQCDLSICKHSENYSFVSVRIGFFERFWRKFKRIHFMWTSLSMYRYNIITTWRVVAYKRPKMQILWDKRLCLCCRFQTA
jgi:hypothetical protein